MLLLALVACLPYDGLDPDQPRVQDARYVDCSMTAVFQAQRPNGNWQTTYDRAQEYDAWGNLAHDRIDEVDGPTYREITQVFRGQWLDARDTADSISGPLTESSERYTWDGIFLQELESDDDGLVRVTTYSSDGVNPYDHSVSDTDGDGDPDAESEFRWSSGNVIGVDTDYGRDGTLDLTRLISYDAEGRAISEDVEGRDDYVYTTWEWGGPHDNLLAYRSESGQIDGGSTVVEVSVVWDGGWTEATFEYLTDGAIDEIDTETYDSEGRMLTRLRESPTGAFNSAREEWTWDCP
ncbi:MAG: hypothetical protein R3F61_10600 [Myxococcota bacterium]